MNGKILPLSEASIGLLDYGLLYGFGLFETLRAYGGAPFMLGDHLRRMNRSMIELGLEFRVDSDEISSAVTRLINEAGLAQVNSRIRIAMTPGEGSPTGNIQSCTSPNLWIMASQISEDMDARFSAGVDAVVYPRPRSVVGWLSQMKISSYVDNVIARRYAMARGAFEALFMDSSGRLLEGAVSNLFMVMDSEITTPPAEMGLLPGITRGVVIDMAAEKGIEVVERAIEREEILRAKGCFITNSIIEISSLSSIDGHTMRRSGMVDELRGAYRARVKARR
jgi:branched-subunit amino acid aminotransferase/4-amino-4-deoxychorismate lyase